MVLDLCLLKTDAYFQANIEESFNLIRPGIFHSFAKLGWGWLKGTYDRNQDDHHSIEMKFVTSHWPFLYYRRIIRLDELRAPDLFSVWYFELCLLIFLVDFDELSAQTDNPSVARFYTGKFVRRTIRRTKIELALFV